MPPSASSWCTRRAWGAALSGLLLLGLAACASLPPQDGRSVSSAYTDTADTRLGRAIAPKLQAHPGLDGIVPLEEGVDAFAARALLARTAQRSLDIQYYIWRSDSSGVLLFDALRRAADRGVRVRLLLDDNNTAGLDPLLAALDAHPNIEVRLFNPYVHRQQRLLGLLTDFGRLNRRMHNKSFTADNQVSIVGGRNIGDEYFDASPGVSFLDLDVMTLGPVVQEISRDFDRYWASASSYPLASLLADEATVVPADIAAQAARIRQAPATQAYAQALHASPVVQTLLDDNSPTLWAPARLVSDEPSKGLNGARREDMLLPRLVAIVGQPRKELLLVTPYFVPTAAGMRGLASLVASGTQVSILTNALEATDVAVVHAGYAKWRVRLLQAGIHLYEMKRTAPTPARTRLRNLGSSASSLHAKTFAVDGRRLFVGSFNFDPRSARLNTEMGLVIDSPEATAGMTRDFAAGLRNTAYEVRLDDAGEVVWLDHSVEPARVLKEEPGTSVLKRAWIDLLSLLPLDWLL